MDFSGSIPREFSSFAFAMSSDGGGGSRGSRIPLVAIDYEDIPTTKESLDKWIEDHNLTGIVEFNDAGSDIYNGVCNIIDGGKHLLVPYPTIAEDLLGVTKALNGVLQTVVGIVKLVVLVWNE